MKLSHIPKLTIIFCFFITNNLCSQVIKVELNQISKNRNVPKNFLELFPSSSIKKINVFDNNVKYKTFYCTNKIGSSESTIHEILIKTGEVKISNLNFKISLLDLNKNQKFNDKDTDLLILSRFKEDSISTHEPKLSSTIIKKLPFNFKVGDKFFKIYKIDSNGRFVIISETKSIIYPMAELVIKIEDRTFKTIDNSMLNLNDFLNLKKKIYLNFMSTKCKPCIEKMPKLVEFIDKHEKELIVINFFTPEDKNDEILKLVKQFNLKSNILISTDQFNKEMNLVSYPYGVLLNSTGFILNDYTNFNAIVF